MGTIPPSFIQSVRERTDLIEVMSSRIELKKHGHRYKALCPFHNEKTPSFSVNGEQQFYYCFGCGAKGDAIEFIMQYDHLDFIDALALLAGQLGLELPQTQSNGDDQQVSKAPYYTLLAQCSDHYQKQLKASSVAIDYLKQRGLSGEIAKDYRLGFAVDQWDALLKQLPRTEEERLHQCGMLVKKDSGGYYDRFRKRIMFPIRDTRGRVIGFGGRALSKDQQPKYINSPETPVFHKNQALYGLYEALQANRHLDNVIIVEGYMDVIALAQHGIRNAVATLGTATNPKHLHLLLRYTQSVTFCFDGDRAGREAAWHALEVNLPLLRDGIVCRFVLLPEGEDPDSLIRQHGATAVQQQLNQGIEASDFLFQHLDTQFPRHDIADIARYAKAAQSLIQTLPAGLYHDLLQKRLSDHLAISPEQLATLQTNKPSPQPQSDPHNSEPHIDSTPINAQQLLQSMPPIRMAIALLLQQPKLLQQVPKQVFELTESHNEFRLFKHLLAMLSEPEPPTITEWVASADNPKLSQYLAILLAWEPSFPVEGVGPEFDGLMRKLIKQNIQAQANQLIEQAKQRELTLTEKQTLQSLLLQAAE